VPATVQVDAYVNIIQHPGGGPKQIGLYHNTVAYVGEGRVQYLTDTLPGSSGAPVFDGSWNVVALHHSGGMLREPGTKNVVYRNEGIAVNTVIDDLRNAGILA
jgi:V8-like Glu-specific endopeptidase